MTGYAPSWVFAAIAVTALVGVAACTLSVALRPIVTGVMCRHGARDAEAVPLLFTAVGVLATTFRMFGA